MKLVLFSLTLSHTMTDFLLGEGHQEAQNTNEPWILTWLSHCSLCTWQVLASVPLVTTPNPASTSSFGTKGLSEGQAKGQDYSKHFTSDQFFKGFRFQN